MTPETQKILGQYADVKERSVLQIESMVRQSVTPAISTINHLVTIFRWNQMELAILRALEAQIRNYDGGFGPGSSTTEAEAEDTQELLLGLDNLREQLRLQQQGELDKENGETTG